MDGRETYSFESGHFNMVSCQALYIFGVYDALLMHMGIRQLHQQCSMHCRQSREYIYEASLTFKCMCQQGIHLLGWETLIYIVGEKGQLNRRILDR